MNLQPLNPYNNKPKKRSVKSRSVTPTWITPVTDRTAEDVERAKYLMEKGYPNLTASEKAEWDAGLKGCLNRSDIDRILNNIELLAEVLELNIPHWASIPYTPVIEDFSYYILFPVQTIRSSYSVYDDTPPAPSTSTKHPTWKTINDIEQILLDVYTIIMSNFYYDSSDQIEMGDEVGLIL